VKDLHYGDVLFYFYQDDFFDSITRLLAARQLERLRTRRERRNCCSAVCICRWANMSKRKHIRTAVELQCSEGVRNKAWFYLGKVWYQRGYWKNPNEP